MKRALVWIGGGLAALILAGAIALNLSPYGRIYIPAGTGITAKQICSLVWVSGLESDNAQAMYIAPLLDSAGSGWAAPSSISRACSRPI